MTLVTKIKYGLAIAASVLTIAVAVVRLAFLIDTHDYKRRQRNRGDFL